MGSFGAGAEETARDLGRFGVQGMDAGLVEAEPGEEELLPTLDLLRERFGYLPEEQPSAALVRAYMEGARAERRARTATRVTWRGA